MLKMKENQWRIEDIVGIGKPSNYYEEIMSINNWKKLLKIKK